MRILRIVILILIIIFLLGLIGHRVSIRVGLEREQQAQAADFHIPEITREETAPAIDVPDIKKLETRIERCKQGDEKACALTPAEEKLELKQFVNSAIELECQTALPRVCHAAYKIAQCESGFNPYAKNPKSTAKGVFQFLDKTWKDIGAAGHQFDYKENVRQFFIWYPVYPSWWNQCLK